MKKELSSFSLIEIMSALQDRMAHCARLHKNQSIMKSGETYYVSQYLRAWNAYHQINEYHLGVHKDGRHSEYHPSKYFSATEIYAAGKGL